MLSDIAGTSLESSEGTWNLGIGFFAVVEADQADSAIESLISDGFPAWRAGTVERGEAPAPGFIQGAKGVDGGAVRLVGSYTDGVK